MFDGSALPVEENAAATEAVARVCRSFGVPLEAEIGELCRLDDRGNKIRRVQHRGSGCVVRASICQGLPSRFTVSASAAMPTDFPADTCLRISGWRCWRSAGSLQTCPLFFTACPGMDEELVKALRATAEWPKSISAPRCAAEDM
ncbi:MAG: class II fructose-bisphosphate aldolase [Enterocloster bolteae]